VPDARAPCGHSHSRSGCVPRRVSAAGTELHLAKAGSTDYVIVQPAASTKVDTYAVKELAKYLKQATGANFPVVDPGELADNGNAIFVGLSALARAHLGEDPLASLQQRRREPGPDRQATPQTQR